MSRTVLSLRLPEQPGRVTGVVVEASDVAIYCCDYLRRAINLWLLRAALQGVRIADYRIICVVRGTDGDLEGVGYAANGNAVMYDDVWTVAEARDAIAQGNRLYTLSPSGGYAQVKRSGENLSAISDHGTGDQLDDLPTCGG